MRWAPERLVVSVLPLLVTLCVGCVIAQRPVEVPQGEQAAVIVGSAALHEPMQDVARHAFIALRASGRATWDRWEVLCCPGRRGLGTVRHRKDVEPLSDYGGGGGDVRIHGVWQGARAERMIACIEERAHEYPYRHRYRGWPGPNSNTFVDWMARACRMRVDLPAPNIGKDYRGWFGVSRTSGRTGFQVETPVVGLKLGLTEGIEVHVLGKSIGIDWWPPAIIVPVGPGRIGIDDR